MWAPDAEDRSEFEYRLDKSASTLLNSLAPCIPRSSQVRSTSLGTTHAHHAPVRRKTDGTIPGHRFSGTKFQTPPLSSAAVVHRPLAIVWALGVVTSSWRTRSGTSGASSVFTCTRDPSDFKATLRRLGLAANSGPTPPVLDSFPRCHPNQSGNTTSELRRATQAQAQIAQTALRVTGVWPATPTTPQRRKSGHYSRSSTR